MTQQTGPRASEVISLVSESTKKDYELNQRVLSLGQYVDLVTEHPEIHLRGSAQYVLQMLDQMGSETIQSGSSSIHRYRLFDEKVDAVTARVVGQEQVQEHIHRCLKSFARQGINNKLILLHGPNGSSKSSLIRALMGGMERYSLKPEGAIYTLNWIFPIERYTKGGIGLNTPSTQVTPLDSYARLPDEAIAARIPCDLKDHPLLVIPKEIRKNFLEKALGKEKFSEFWSQAPAYLTEGELCHRCCQISDALLVTSGGNLEHLFRHIQVERFYFSKRYRKGLATVEPQMHVDARYHQLTYNKSLGLLPPYLQSLNLFSLTGDLIDSNRGIIEYSDLLKRPIDSFKYLLGTCEDGSVSVENSTAFLDTVMIGSTNELQLDAFKEFPDFTSFKARIELIRVPYLLALHQEQEIYDSQIHQISGEKHCAPHVAWVTAFWAILTRLKKPNPTRFPPHLNALVNQLTPLDKAKIYDTGEIPIPIAGEERKLLKASLKKIEEEYQNIPYYEGRTGASAREMKSLLLDAAQNPEFACLSPLSVLKELDAFIKRTSEYDFLKEEVKDGFHDAQGFIETVKQEYLNLIDREVRDSVGLYDSNQWEDFLKKYVAQISVVLKKEKITNKVTRELEDPDLSLIAEFEKIIGAPTSETEQKLFRENAISQIGVWSLENPKTKVNYSKVFPDLWAKLEKHYFESQKSLMNQMSQALTLYDTDHQDEHAEGSKLARQTVSNMKSKLGYCPSCAKEVIMFLMHERY